MHLKSTVFDEGFLSMNVTYQNTVIMGIQGFLGLTAIISNGIILFTFIKFPVLRRGWFTFIGLLAGADFMIGR